jgi:enoyl-CoA hydratase/carnithine racemase
MDGQPLVLVDRVDGGAILRLNRPEKRNAVNDALSSAAIAAIDDLEADDEVRAIVLTGSGGSFCAGQDMAEATGRVQRTGNGGAGTLSVRVGSVQKPIIAAIDGYCMGGGAVLALQCDIRLGADTAVWRFPGANYGLVVAASLLPAVVGQSRAKDLIFTTRRVDAAEAHSIGLLDRLVPVAELETLAREYVRMIAQNSPGALAWSKRVINAAALDTGAGSLEGEANWALRGGADHVDRFAQATDRVVGPRA